MRLQNAFLMSVLFATACGPESGPVPDETGAQAGALASPVITFWEGNFCGGDQVGSYPYNTAATLIPNSSGSGWSNDEARSMKLFQVPVGTVIRVYNSASGSHGDDWSEIVINQYVEQLCVTSFEVTGTPNPYYSLRYCDTGGLDGKVSQVRAQPYAFVGDSCNGTWRYY
ncbi:hypothetical protein [Stigmatella aurantiaca]|uniref:Conserved uncharacterized protein n=1 Tax=Stigmatella aurantiaca (strain DW4/3-1) TaxID=378806 RepID=Q08QR5_STIAD|nr:hypothetical protein [Stigmatella aurantiaca]ADO71571.1 conserved uncharacterized protein [Stigmatella aurantiaca DW4/3-1]EAU62831.1 conserved hypothetical protein [Stigmatella aurantiaca DW4/3-1]